MTSTGTAYGSKLVMVATHSKLFLMILTYTYLMYLYNLDIILGLVDEDEGTGDQQYSTDS